MGESLKVNYQVLWRLIDLHFLQSWHMVFTFGTVPLVLACKSFLLTESGKAIVDRDIARIAHGIYSLVWRIQVNFFPLGTLNALKVNFGS